MAPKRIEVINIIKATSLGTAVILVAAPVFRISMVTPVFRVVFWAVSTAMAVVSRLILRYLLKQVRTHGRNLRLVLIVGTSPCAVGFARKID